MASLVPVKALKHRAQFPRGIGLGYTLPCLCAPQDREREGCRIVEGELPEPI